MSDFLENLESSPTRSDHYVHRPGQPILDASPEAASFLQSGLANHHF